MKIGEQKEDVISNSLTFKRIEHENALIVVNSRSKTLFFQQFHVRLPPKYIGLSKKVSKWKIHFMDYCMRFGS